MPDMSASDTASFVINDPATGAEALRLLPDGSVRIDKARIRRLWAHVARVIRLQVTSKQGVAAATFADNNDDADEFTFRDGPGASKAASIAKDGTFKIHKARIRTLVASFLSSSLITLLTKQGASGAELSGAPAAVPYGAFVRDFAGFLPLAVDGKGKLLADLSDARIWAGGKLAADATRIVWPRLRSAKLLHDLYVQDLTTGVVKRLTEDAADKADFLNPAIAGSHVLYTKRTGRRSQLRAVPIAGGPEVRIVPERSIHMLGDSFNSPDLLAAVFANLLDKRRRMTRDGVGGSYLSAQAARFGGGTVTLAETGTSQANAIDNGNGTYTYLGTPQFWDRTLIIMDGGLSDADPIAQIAKIVAKLTPLGKRWLYVQSGISADSTPEQVAAKLAKDALTQAAYPNNFVWTYDYMRANGTGTKTGPNGGEVWPADCLGDLLHPSTAQGVPLLGACIATDVNNKGW